MNVRKRTLNCSWRNLSWVCFCVHDSPRIVRIKNALHTKICINITHRTPWTVRKTNAWVLDKIGNRLMLREMVRRRKLRFFGHVIRRKGLERTIITGKVNGKRKRGRPPTSWLKDIKSRRAGSSFGLGGGGGQRPKGAHDFFFCRGSSVA